MTNKSLKQYIYQKFGLKIKRIGVFDVRYAVKAYHMLDTLNNAWEFINKYDKYGDTLSNQLFINVAGILDAIKKSKDYEE